MKRIIHLGVPLMFCIALMGDQTNSYDLTVLGYARFSGSLGRDSITHMDTLKELSINFINLHSKVATYIDIPQHIVSILKNNDTSFGNVVLFDAQMSYFKSLKVPWPQDKIRIAYSMVESTKVPEKWVTILNNNFDAVVVPDKWLVPVYEKSGVNLPIFVIPLPLYLNKFLQLPRKKRASKPFKFGVCARLSKNKNIDTLLEAFAQEFGNNPKVFLRIHSPWSYYADQTMKRIEELGIQNVKLTTTPLEWKNYIQLLSSFDCYVLLSRGEGFSKTPREALAAGIPCILSNNTAHMTICKTGFVRPVAATKPVAHDGEFYNQSLGFNFMCSVEDVRKALRDVYTNYAAHLRKARKGRIWVKQYLPEVIKSRYKALVKPTKVVLGNENKVLTNCLITNSESLYKKYCQMLQIPLSDEQTQLEPTGEVLSEKALTIPTEASSEIPLSNELLVSAPALSSSSLEDTGSSCEDAVLEEQNEQLVVQPDTLLSIESTLEQENQLHDSIKSPLFHSLCCMINEKPQQ